MKESFISYHDILRYLSMKHFVFDKMETTGLEHSTASSVLFYEVSFDVAFRVVGGIVLAEDERLIYLVSVALASGRSLMVNND